MLRASRKASNSNVSVTLAPHNRVLSNLSIVPKWKTMKISSETSKAWKYYGCLFANNELIDDTRYYCHTCLEDETKKFEEHKSGHLSKVHSVAVGTGTGNMKLHLYKLHKIDVDNDKAVNRQKQLIRAWVGASSSQRQAANRFEVNRELVMWFATDLRPFTMVGDKGFVHFFEKNVGIQLPDRSTLSRTPLIDVYKSLKSIVMTELEQCSSVALMFDGWTDRYKRTPFLGIRASVITKEWETKLFTLSCTPLESHTGKALKDHIKEIVSQFFARRPADIKLHSTHDGAANMFLASRLLNSEDPQHCIAHTLNLLLSVDGINKTASVDELVHKCKDVVNALHFKAYTLAQELAYKDDIEMYERIRKVAEARDVVCLDMQFPTGLQSVDEDPEDDIVSHEHRSLKSMTPTRWNSALAMLESVGDMDEAVNNMLKKIGKVDLVLDPDELALIKSLSNFLKSFSELTEMVSSVKQSIAVIPAIKLQLQEICKANEGDLAELKELKTHLSQAIEKRFKISDSVKLAVTLHPAFRQLYTNEEIKNILTEKADSRPMSDNSVIATSEAAEDAENVPFNLSKLSEPARKLLKLVDSQRANRGLDNMIEEIDRYVSHRPSLEERADNLLFWKRHCQLYPRLAKLAREYLGIPCSSVPAEAMFSVTGIVMNSKRSSLDPLTLDMLSFIHDNLSCINDSMFGDTDNLNVTDTSHTPT